VILYAEGRQKPNTADAIEPSVWNVIEFLGLRRAGLGHVLLLSTLAGDRSARRPADQSAIELRRFFGERRAPTPEGRRGSPL
jgi:hypothetical protein